MAVLLGVGVNTWNDILSTLSRNAYWSVELSLTNKIVVRIFDTYDYNLEIKSDFTNYLKESC